MIGLKFVAISVTFLSFQLIEAVKLNPKIVIIGAGSSGLAAGTKLLEYGFTNLIILEAEPRIGGRIHTVPFGDGFVDLGAQWCHGEVGNVVYEMVEKYGILRHTTEAEQEIIFARSNGEIVDHELYRRLLNIFDNIVKYKDSELPNYVGSFGDYVKEKFEAYLKLPENRDIDDAIAKEALNSFDKERCSADGCDSLSQVSAPLLVDYKNCEGDQSLVWKQYGYKQFLEVLLRTKETGAEYGVLQGHIETSKKVKQILWQRNDGKVLVITEDGVEILADHVIVTVSLGVLKANHESLFQPALPLGKLMAIENIAFGTVNKAFLEFDVPFWPRDWNGVSFFWRAEDFEQLKASQHEWLPDIFGVYTVADRPRLLSAWINGPYHERIEKLSGKDEKNAIMYLLKRFLVRSNMTVAEPVDFVRTIWASEPNFRGSYSYHSIETEATGVTVADLADPLFAVGFRNKPLVMFAGEATHAHYYSTVHGAVESGFREAKRLKEFYNKKRYVY